MDHGTQFTSEKFLKTLKDHDIQPIFSSIRHPQGNIVERIHREINRFFRTLMDGKHTGWAKYVPIIQNCMPYSLRDH